jgi:poly [ADP-ribose] polymerase
MLQKMNLKSAVSKTEQLSQTLVDFLNYIWGESIGNLDEILDMGSINSENTAFMNISIEQVEKAELVLHKQRVALNEKTGENFSSEFFKSLPFKRNHGKPASLTINTYKSLLKWYELCQVLRDIIAIGEETNWNVRSSAQSIYRSIGTYVNRLNEFSDEFKNLRNHLLDSVDKSELEAQNKDIEILAVYEIARPNELLTFNKEQLDNVKLLFHGSRVENFIGILSRGLLLPKVHNVNGLEGVELSRTDVGFLGAGVYFSDELTTSLKYALKSNAKQTSLVAVCEVALGKVSDVYDYQFELKQAPSGFNSVHGVKRTADVDSKFEDSDYCIYDLAQYRIKYVAEVRVRSSEEEMIDESPVVRCFLKNESDVLAVNDEAEVGNQDLSELKLTGNFICF